MEKSTKTTQATVTPKIKISYIKTNAEGVTSVSSKSFDRQLNETEAEFLDKNIRTCSNPLNVAKFEADVEAGSFYGTYKSGKSVAPGVARNPAKPFENVDFIIFEEVGSVKSVYDMKLAKGTKQVDVIAGLVNTTKANNKVSNKNVTSVLEALPQDVIEANPSLKLLLASLEEKVAKKASKKHETSEEIVAPAQTEVLQAVEM
jgi:hypothetical protein